MSDIVEKLRCFNSLTGKRDGGYCEWEGAGKCLRCQAADEIERLQGLLLHETLRYEKLRREIDGGSESMTHEDAIEAIRYWKSIEDQLS